MAVTLDQICFYQPSGVVDSPRSARRNNSSNRGPATASEGSSSMAIALNAPAANRGNRELDSAELHFAPTAIPVYDLASSVETNEARAGYSLDGRDVFSSLRCWVGLEFLSCCVEASQFPEAPRDESALAGARDMLLNRYSSHARSLSHKQPLLAVGSSDLDDYGMDAAQRPGIPVPNPDFDPAHSSLRQSDMLYHLSSMVARISPVEPDVTDQEMHVSACLDMEGLDRVHDDTVSEEGTCPAIAVDPNPGASMSPSLASSPSSRIFPSMLTGLQPVQSDSKGTSHTRGDASSLDTAGNAAPTSNNPATPTRPSPRELVSGSAGTLPSQTLMNLLSPPKIKRIARLGAAAWNSPGARHERQAIAHSESNDDSSSEDGSDSDQSYTTRSPDSAGGVEDGSLDEDDTPASKRRRISRSTGRAMPNPATAPLPAVSGQRRPPQAPGLGASPARRPPHVIHPTKALWWKNLPPRIRSGHYSFPS
ncbi:hypothetical protein AK830_g12288 [Neonectria ditissima]|uniref:Uncharacterized protein n=1 Tax=Neonectria ditissima TaxID=78410 RepID=A0A0P7B5S2_9HYPO|nr:hypothetical protein AK830_g12288 [Neonectria ditissima]